MLKSGLYLCLFLMSFLFPDKKKIKVWLIGDSTMSVKQVSAYPETGWGMPFVHFFDSTVTIDNRAKNGRSTRSFREEGLWKEVLTNLQEGDYVFIQFGHNDEVKEKKGSYTTPEEFKGNLTRFVLESRARKSIPILLTPAARRRFDTATGKVIGTHNEYSALVRMVAKDNNVHLIDLDAKSQSLIQALGVESSTFLYNHLIPGEHPNYPNGIQDNTHFSELGARKMAAIVLSEIKALRLELADRIVKKNPK